MPRVAAIVLALVSWLAPTPAQASATSDYETATITAVNNTRAHHHKPLVRRGPCVDRYAEDWARKVATWDTIRHRNQYTIGRACNGRLVGEVIARGFTHPSFVVGAWLLSPTHRAVILDGRYRRIGVGAVRDTTGRWVVVANFIRH